MGRNKKTKIDIDRLITEVQRGLRCTTLNIPLTGMPKRQGTVENRLKVATACFMFKVANDVHGSRQSHSYVS